MILFINTKASDSQMLKMKLDMQLFTDNSTTTPETNSDTILYGMLIILLPFTLLYIFQYIYVLGPLCLPHSLLFPNFTSTSSKQHESVLLPLSFSRSDSLITWQNTLPRQSAYLSSRSPSDTLDKWPESPPNNTTFPLPHLSPSSPPSSHNSQASRAPKVLSGPAGGRAYLAASSRRAMVNKIVNDKRQCRTSYVRYEPIIFHFN